MSWYLKFFFISTLFLFFSLSFHTVTDFDQDLGRHLLFGKIISQTWSVPKTNLLSFTWPNFSFVNSHWLSEVIFFQIDKLFGVVGLLWMKVLVFVSAMFLTVWTAWRFSKNLLAVAVSFVLLVPILLERTDIRPEIFSFLMVAIFVHILFLQKRKLFWLLPILQIFWVNLHVYFLLGSILVGINLIGELWSNFKKEKNISSTLLNTKYLILNTLTVFVSCLINPNFLSGALFPLTVFQNYGYAIVENQNIILLSSLTNNPNINFFWFAMAFSLIGLFLSDWKKIGLKNFLFFTLSLLPIWAIRNFPLFFLIEFPVVTFFLANIRKKILPQKYSGQGVIAALLFVMIAMNLIRIVRLLNNDYYLSLDSAKRFGSTVVEPGKEALDFFKKQNLPGPIFNNFDMGSYIAYRLNPQTKVFVDGRPEAYPKEFFQNVYIPMQTSSENFSKADKVFQFRTVIFSHTDATPWGVNFLRTIVKNPNYQLVYLDSYAVIFVKREKSFEKAPPEINEENFLSRVTIPKDHLKMIMLGRIAEIFGWTNTSFELVKKAQSLAPNSKMANTVLGNFYLSNPATSIVGQQLLQKSQSSNVVF